MPAIGLRATMLATRTPSNQVKVSKRKSPTHSKSHCPTHRNSLVLKSPGIVSTQTNPDDDDEFIELQGDQEGRKQIKRTHYQQHGRGAGSDN